MKQTLVSVTGRSKFITLQEVFHGAVKDKIGIFPVCGDCMEGANIIDGGYIAVDFTHFPRPSRMENGEYVIGDPCLCYANAPGKNRNNPPTIMCKQYSGRWMGHMVSTQYEK